jgi:uncharacterized membrane protein YdjX (TVP38/TMEM64 family)
VSFSCAFDDFFEGVLSLAIECWLRSRKFLMNQIVSILKHPHVRFGLVCAISVGSAVLLSAWVLGVNVNVVLTLWKSTNTFLVEHPSALFIAMVILPALPIPTSALQITAGIIWRDRPIMACSLCLVSMITNLSLTYWMAAGPGRRLVERLLAATSYRVPELPRDDHMKLVLILKLTPGIPFFIQNYLSGFFRAPFRLFLLVSILSNGVFGVGMVLSGVGIGDGKLIPAISGISFIALSALLTYLIREWMTKRKKRGVGGH